MIIRRELEDQDGYQLILRPNCSMKWSLVVRFYLAFCLFSLSIALGFAYFGYWMVLPFSGMEIIALGCGLYLVCRKTYKQEVINFIDDQIIVEKGYEKVLETHAYNIGLVRLIIDLKDKKYKNHKINIGMYGKYVEVGGFLSYVEKDSLACELNDGILRRKIVSY
jgi:uncharacterized membrane protein